MITPDSFRQFALSFPEATEHDHWGKPSFRVKGKKIFATLNVSEQRAVLKLSLIDQNVYHRFDAAVFYPVPNKWGQQGWTNVELSLVREDMLKDALSQAWKQCTGKVK